MHRDVRLPRRELRRLLSALVIDGDRGTALADAQAFLAGVER